MAVIMQIFIIHLGVISVKGHIFVAHQHHRSLYNIAELPKVINDLLYPYEGFGNTQPFPNQLVWPGTISNFNDTVKPNANDNHNVLASGILKEILESSGYDQNDLTKGKHSKEHNYDLYLGSTDKLYLESEASRVKYPNNKTDETNIVVQNEQQPNHNVINFANRRNISIHLNASEPLETNIQVNNYILNKINESQDPSVSGEIPVKINQGNYGVHEKMSGQGVSIQNIFSSPPNDLSIIRNVHKNPHKDFTVHDININTNEYTPETNEQTTNNPQKQYFQYNLAKQDKPQALDNRDNLKREHMNVNTEIHPGSDGIEGANIQNNPEISLAVKNNTNDELKTNKDISFLSVNAAGVDTQKFGIDMSQSLNLLDKIGNSNNVNQYLSLVNITPVSSESNLVPAISKNSPATTNSVQSQWIVSNNIQTIPSITDIQSNTGQNAYTNSPNNIYVTEDPNSLILSSSYLNGDGLPYVNDDINLNGEIPGNYIQKTAPYKVNPEANIPGQLYLSNNVATSFGDQVNSEYYNVPSSVQSYNFIPLTNDETILVPINNDQLLESGDGKFNIGPWNNLQTNIASNNGQTQYVAVNDQNIIEVPINAQQLMQS